MDAMAVPALTGYESQVDGYDGTFKFFVPDLGV